MGSRTGIDDGPAFRADKFDSPDNARSLPHVVLENRGLAGAARHDADRHAASTYALMDAVCDRLACELALPETGFVDAGSGKGKALLGAARSPWCSVRGVELSARLDAIARANVARLGLGARIRCERGNAAELVLAPYERVVYLCDPFTGATLEHCLDRIVAAGESARRFVVHVNPTEHAAFTSRFDLVERGLVEPGRIEVAYFRTRS